MTDSVIINQKTENENTESENTETETESSLSENSENNNSNILPVINKNELMKEKKQSEVDTLTMILYLLCDNNDFPINNKYRDYIKVIELVNKNQIAGIIVDNSGIILTIKSYIKELSEKKIMISGNQKNKKYKLIVGNMINIIVYLDTLYNIFENEEYNEKFKDLQQIKEKFKSYESLYDILNPGLDSKLVLDKENKMINYYYFYKELYFILINIITILKF